MKKSGLIFIFAVLILFAVSAVSAEDANSTEIIETDENHDTVNVCGEDLAKDDSILKSDENTIKQETETHTKEDLKITTKTNYVKKETDYHIYLTDMDGDAVSGKELKIRIDDDEYEKTTNANGRASVKIDSSQSSLFLNVSFEGDEQYNAFNKTLQVYIENSLSITIGNSKLLTNGYLRVYLSGPRSSISKKTIKIKIGNKAFTAKTTTEGYAIIKPKMGVGTYDIEVSYGNYKVTKKVKCIKGNVKNPLKTKVKTKNGVPDIDVMPANFVMGDGNAKYTLKKSQYREVLKRDSYTLFLYGKLSKYTFFKTKESPKTYHILKREKWNVIERQLYKKLVKKNKKNYWPKTLTASLKGKSYTYAEVRDVQNKGYTCGPTSASVCSQVLKNYYSEKYFQIKMHVTDGVNIPVIKKVLGKHHFKADYFYSNSFNSAIKKLKKGAALIAFLPNHYVSIIDVSKDGKKILVSNSYGKYNIGGASRVPTDWVSVKYFKSKFAGIGLVVKLNYKLSKKVKQETKNYYNSMGAKFVRQNTNERIPDTA